MSARGSVSTTRPEVARVIYLQTRALVEKDYIEACRALGASDLRILGRHILPHLVPTMLVWGTLGIATTVLLEATLSFLGVGVRPPTPSWGLMISGGITNMRSHPHMLISPALTLGVTLLAFTFLGDGLRDAMDPYMKR